MDFLQSAGGSDGPNTSFFNHVFSTTDEGKGELLNVAQYAIMGVVPVIALNKLVQQFVPEADHEKSSLELTIEILIQLIIMFCGIVLIHRGITYFPTYSGFHYDNLNITNVVLAFLVIVLSIQTKLGLKANILYDRVLELWNGPDYSNGKSNVRNKVRVSNGSSHSPSQADHLDHSGVQMDMFPPAPAATAVKQSSGSYDMSMRGNPAQQMAPAGPMAANSLLGSAFGALF